MDDIANPAFIDGKANWQINGHVSTIRHITSTTHF
jgi:hypothetical protein